MSTTLSKTRAPTHDVTPHTPAPAHAQAKRRSIRFDDELWREVEEYRASEHAATESEAVRRLVVAGLRAVRAASRDK